MLTHVFKEFIEKNINNIEIENWAPVIRDLPYNYELSQNVCENLNSLFLIFKESNIEISNNIIEETFNKLGYNKSDCTIIPLYNNIKGDTVEESLNELRKHLDSTIKNFYINSLGNKTTLYEILDQLEDILGSDIDTFKGSNYNFIKYDVISEPVKLRAGF